MEHDEFEEKIESPSGSEKNSERDKSSEEKLSQQRIQEIMNSAMKENMTSITKIQEKMLEPWQPILRMQANMRAAMEPFRKSMMNSISAMSQIQGLSSSFKKAFSISYDFSGFNEIARKIGKIVSESLPKIKIPSISEKRKRELIEANRLWGSYGWTINPYASLETVFNCMFVDKKTADSIALRQCSTQTMEQIFDLISQTKRVKESDIEEAVFDYKHKQYKSCAFILFSLVDAALIRLQRRSDLNGKRRQVGLSAVKQVRNRTETDVNKELFFSCLFIENLFACLEKVFESGKDFKMQPDVINRNFLDHGMMTKRVRKKDCIQLFLLYYNVLKLLDMIY